ncbi:MAG: hypothetical protein QOE86_635 [Solirubrobacteraceae bacterium]|jgi:uncharacterized cupin superfamily protein|nr:hypothetical protein [Solirubrobacteraceae bacterium]
MGVPEAELERQEGGLVPVTDGWFVMNLSEAQGHANGHNGTYAAFEADDRRFPHFGFNVHILSPGQAPGMYHAESAQETFLVLSGECLLLVEGQERTLRQWDVFHCAPGTAHIMVGAGDGPCAILMAGARGPDFAITYPVHEPAARHGASVAEETDDPRVAYAGTPQDWRPVRLPWPLDG